MNKYFDRLIQLANESVKSGGRPFACLIVKNGEILAEAVNEFNHGDPVAHAELIAIRKVVEKAKNINGMSGQDLLRDSDFYLLSHPCPMCLSAIIYCNPNKVFFGAQRNDFSKYFQAGYKHATYDTLYDEVAKPWSDRKLPMEFVPDTRINDVVKLWREMEDKKRLPSKSIVPTSAQSKSQSQCPMSQFFQRQSFDNQSALSLTDNLSPNEKFRLDSRFLNSTMKRQYQETIRKVGRNVFPLIIALDNEENFEGMGGSFTLFLEDGTIKRIVPAKNSNYEIYKNIAHIPLLLCTIIIPYFSNILSPVEFMGKLMEVKNCVDTVKKSLSEVTYLFEGQQILASIIHNSEELISLAVKGAINLDLIKAYFDKNSELLRFALSIAVKIQIQMVMPELDKWKKELGPELWKKLYAVIPTVWTVSQGSPREQMLTKIMDPETVGTNLIIAQGITNIEDAKTLLGRIVFDRCVADLIFDRVSKVSEDILIMKQALSSQVDIAAHDSCAYLREIGAPNPSSKL